MTIEVPTVDALMTRVEKFAETVRRRGEEASALTVRDVTDFGEIVGRALERWPASVSTDILWVRVFADADTMTVDDDDDEAGFADPMVVELIGGSIRVRMSDHNEDSADVAGERIVLADVGNMHYQEAPSARDELTALGWTDYSNDVLEPPSEVMDVVRSNPDGAAPATTHARGSVVARLDEGMAQNIAEAQSGDVDAKKRIDKRYRPYIKAFVRQYIGRQVQRPRSSANAIADDITADTMGRLLAGHKGPRGTSAPAIERYIPEPNGKPTSFATFVTAIAKHVTTEYFRQHKREHVVSTARSGAAGADEQSEDDALDAMADDEQRVSTPEESLLQAEEDEGLADNANRLRRHQTESIDEAFRSGLVKPEHMLILQLRAKGKTYRQIADELNIGTDAVGVRLYRARKQVEELSGIPVTGIVVPELAVLRPSKRGRPRTRTNPDDQCDECALYFEDVCDLCDLCDDGVIDADTFQQCFCEWLARFA